MKPPEISLMSGLGIIAMKPDDGNKESAKEEVLVYVGPSPTREDPSSSREEEVLFRRRQADDLGLAKVTLDNEALIRLRDQAQWIAAGIQTPHEDQEAKGFVVESVTLHVGLSATGQFFFIGAGVEAAIDITWRHRGA